MPTVVDLTQKAHSATYGVPPCLSNPTPIDVINVYNVYKKFFVNAFIILSTFITARCTLVQSAVLRLHVVCLSVTLVNCDHIVSKIISPLVSLGRSLFATPT